MHGQLPIIWDKAQDFFVFDPLGNKYIDFTSGIFIANAGHNNPQVKKALQEAMNGPMSTYTYMNEARLSYLEFLIENTPSQFESFPFVCRYRSNRSRFETHKALRNEKGLQKI